MAQQFATRDCRHCGGTGKELDPHAVGKQMRELRRKHGVSLRFVAKHLNLSAPYISDLERGNRPFSEELIVKYREVLK